MQAVRQAGPALEVRAVVLNSLGERYRRYRLADSGAERAMAQSLQQWGQLAPVVAWPQDEHWEVVDGFKRLTAARELGWPTLLVRELAGADERTVKAAIYGLNHVGSHLQEVEEAWLVRALVREDGLSQVDVAALLRRHKSWVCRRLALLEKLSEPVQADLEVGVLAPSLARQLLRLPAGNQHDVLAAARREQLTAEEVRGVVDLWLQTSSSAQQVQLLAAPRAALQRAQAKPAELVDVQLSMVGNRVVRQVLRLLDELRRWRVWLQRPGLAMLPAGDGLAVRKLVAQVVEETQDVAAATTAALRQEEER
jgi:ParB-like chromosome segregation protein Spo0J